MAFKPFVIEYQSKNATTGLSASIKGQVYLNHAGTVTAVAVGVNAISFSETDATNC